MPKKISDKININQLAELFKLPSWDRIDELNQEFYWEQSKGAPDEDAAMDAERAAQDEVFAQWYDAVEHVAEKLFEEHGLELHGIAIKRKGADNRRPYEFKIVPMNSWNDAADRIRETVNGVGYFHFNNLREFLSSGPYTAKQAALSHLAWIRDYPAVYGGPGAHQMYEAAWR